MQGNVSNESNESNITEIIGYAGGVLTTVCLVPQLWRIISTKSSGDISIVTFLVLLCGQALWITYGVLTDDLRIIFPNVISVVLSLSIVCSTVYFRSRGSHVTN